MCLGHSFLSDFLKVIKNLLFSVPNHLLLLDFLALFNWFILKCIMIKIYYSLIKSAKAWYKCKRAETSFFLFWGQGFVLAPIMRGFEYENER